MLTISYDEALVNMNIPNLEIPWRKHHSAETSHCEGPGHRTASSGWKDKDNGLGIFEGAGSAAQNLDPEGSFLCYTCGQWFPM